ncbi:MAG: Decaprenyl-phosphate N-acetylglucosaminephosphotransferase [Holosporales bacterium]
MNKYILLNIFFSVAIALLILKFGKKIAPSERCSHKTPTVTSGGIIFVVMFFLNTFYCYFLGNFIVHPLLLIAFFLIALVGFIDDLVHLSYKTRFIVQFFVALLVLFSGLKVNMPFLNGYTFGIDILLTILLVVGLINACNFFDGLNGLLAGSVLLLLIFSYLFISTDQKTFIGLILIPLIVFYAFNFPNAKLFMGDTGSTFLGLFLSILALKNQNDYFHPTETALIHKGLIYTLTPMMFCWFDIFITLSRRLAENRNIFSPWRDYLFHHLFEIGFSHTKIAFIYYVSIFLLSFLTYTLINHPFPFIIALILYGLIQSIFLIFIIKKRARVKHIVFDSIYSKQGNV